jgi:hypothetical protein
MPTVLRLGSLRVVIYPNDHRPAHVHVSGHGFSAIFELNCPAGPVSLRENYGFPEHQIGKIATELETHIAALCEAWRQIHD